MKYLLFILTALAHLLACIGCNVDRTAATGKIRPVIRRIVREEPPPPKPDEPAAEIPIEPQFADEPDEQPAEIGRRRPIIRPRPGPFREGPSENRPPEVEVDPDEALPPMTQEELAELIEELQRLREQEHPASIGPRRPIIRPRPGPRPGPFRDEQPMSEREATLEDTGIWFDVAAFESNMPAKGWKQPAKPSRRVQLVRYTMAPVRSKVTGELNQLCPPCVEQDAEDAPLVANGWVKSADDDAHIRVIMIDADDSQGIAAAENVASFPTTVLVRDGNEVDRFIGVTKRATLVEAFTTAVHNLRPLMKADKPQPFMAGEKKITKEQMDILMNILGKSGPLVLPNSEIVIEQQGITFKIPAGVKATNTVSGSTRRLVFDAASKPSGRWSFLSASADAVVLDVVNYTLTAEMPGMIPDPVIKLLKE